MTSTRGAWLPLVMSTEVSAAQTHRTRSSQADPQHLRSSIAWQCGRGTHSQGRERVNDGSFGAPIDPRLPTRKKIYEPAVDQRG